ncbi:TatD family hydrolase [Neoehrlichia mikurensis]|uniref:TatD family hydrolase n=1 Tax=Neoehrlichia mikurensis TaxID=89586 RepID=A0A9Q9BU53_9RICK|nr:TatD family hydrolase [Neoehrlichia mikurensis]QXK92075.1 TatD family hydrolase [Neoehrlichia mikurensis]QXK92532.1 TatD family hydrolase [Neoehrlichia mikurensis]QXK93768.1 TatD family hydrolase [Neoehrlichia mikurensis]UTO55256.1 TatD family hydrolase [Neoehrlichia mikurensis]UTO56177.1 TatD family hydrolase [Neoehrlichia mikurensis]
MIVDSHCHLNYFSSDEIQYIIDEAEKKGILLMQTVCTTISEFSNLLEIANKYKQVYASVGVHPSNSAEGESISVEKLVDLANNKKVIGIGETGLDFYKYDAHDKQEKSFLLHIDAARKVDLPVIIHSRNADMRMKEVLTSEMKLKEFKGVMHCFASSKDLAMHVIDLGLYISFSGILTFKNAIELQQIARMVPLQQILVETDSPFLCPEPYRGQKNHPAMTRIIVEYLSKLYNKNIDDISKITTENFFRLFNKCSLDYNA